MYITYQIRDNRLDCGVHFDTSAIQFIQSNMYGLTELQRIVAKKLGIISGTYNHFIDSLFISKKHLEYLKETLE